MLPYVASKFALVGFSEGLHAELRHKGVRVTTVCPGLMRTGGEAHADYTGQTKKEQRWFTLAARTPVLTASVNHAANKIYNAVAAGRAEITITPQAWLAARVSRHRPRNHPISRQPRQPPSPAGPLHHRPVHPRLHTESLCLRRQRDIRTGNQPRAELITQRY